MHCPLGKQGEIHKIHNHPVLPSRYLGHYGLMPSAVAKRKVVTPLQALYNSVT